MTEYIHKIARISAITGAVVLTLLAVLMTVSIIGGSIAKIAYSDWFAGMAPGIAAWLEETGIRTIPGMYEIMKIGAAFVIFAFLPITSIEKGHATVDVFTNFLPARLNQFIIAFWEVIFFAVLALISWRLFHGMDRMMTSKMILQELQIPEWYGYAVAFVQMLLASLIAGYTAWGQVLKLITGRDILPDSDGARH